MTFNPQQSANLRALLDCIVPPDANTAGALQNGVENYLQRQFSGDLQAQHENFLTGLDALKAEAQLRHQSDFSELDAASQNELLRDIEAAQVQSEWPLTPQRWFADIVNWANEGFYADASNGANVQGASWQMVGFVRKGDVAISQGKAASASASTCRCADEYDAIVIGAGAGGGVAACVLSEAGQRVLLLERGRDLGFDEIGRDHLRSQRLALYGHNAGPDANHPRVFQEPNGKTHTRLPWQGGYQNNAACIGGGTRIYGAQAWRFMADDFRMASRYGVPEGSSLQDWPLSYDELAPFYAQVERELGVAGDARATQNQSARKEEFPLPPIEANGKTRVLSRAAQKLNWPTLPPPLAINTQPYNGRAACIRCTECVGFACPTEAKNGTHNTYIPRALQTGNCDLLTETIVARIVCDGTNGASRATGVEFFTRENSSSGWQRKTVRAKKIICAAGAVETARLLLLSSHDGAPKGLGNAHDQVGRHLQGHVYSGAYGVQDEIVMDNSGPGVSIATYRWNHGNEGLVGGGMLADDFIKPPIDFWRSSLPPHLPRWGEENKNWMRDNYRRTLQVMGPVQDISSPHARVQLDSDVRDSWDLPVAHLSGTTHPETVRVADFMRHRAEEWLRAAGCHTVWSFPPSLGLSGGQHQAGTCRMSHDPKTGVCDAFGKVHGTDNVWVCDGSVHVTNGGFNPFLTIMTLASRNAQRIVATA